MIKEHDRVALTVPLANEGLEAGDLGTVVDIYRDGQAYEVEFLTLDGNTAAVVTLDGSQVRPVSSRDITHTRELSNAEKEWLCRGATTSAAPLTRPTLPHYVRPD
jgi:hypothetical protein